MGPSGVQEEDASIYIRDSIEAWKEGKAFDWAIRRRTDPRRHVGNISTWQVSRLTRTGEIGYWIEPTTPTKGSPWKLPGRSCRLASRSSVFTRSRCGSRLATTLRAWRKTRLCHRRRPREELLIRGRWIDHTLFSLLDHEFQEREGNELASRKHAGGVAEIEASVG